MPIGALYRGEMARELTSLGHGIEKTHADGRSASKASAKRSRS